MSQTKTKTFSFIHQAGNTPSHSQESLQSFNFFINFFTASTKLASTSWSRHILKETLGRGQDEAESLKIN